MVTGHGDVTCGVRDGQEGPHVQHRGGGDRGHAQHQPHGGHGPPGHPPPAPFTHEPQAAVHFCDMYILNLKYLNIRKVMVRKLSICGQQHRKIGMREYFVDSEARLTAPERFYLGKKEDTFKHNQFAIHLIFL